MLLAYMRGRFIGAIVFVAVCLHFGAARESVLKSSFGSSGLLGNG